MEIYIQPPPTGAIVACRNVTYLLEKGRVVFQVNDRWRRVRKGCGWTFVESSSRPRGPLRTSLLCSALLCAALLCSARSEHSLRIDLAMGPHRTFGIHAQFTHSHLIDWHRLGARAAGRGVWPGHGGAQLPPPLCARSRRTGCPPCRPRTDSSKWRSPAVRLHCRTHRPGPAEDCK